MKKIILAIPILFLLSVAVHAQTEENFVIEVERTLNAFKIYNSSAGASDAYFKVWGSSVGTHIRRGATITTTTYSGSSYNTIEEIVDGITAGGYGWSCTFQRGAYRDNVVQELTVVTDTYTYSCFGAANADILTTTATAGIELELDNNTKVDRYITGLEGIATYSAGTCKMYIEDDDGSDAAYTGSSMTTVTYDNDIQSPYLFVSPRKMHFKIGNSDYITAGRLNIIGYDLKD